MKQKRKRNLELQSAQTAFVRGVVTSGVLALSESRGSTPSVTQVCRVLKAGIAIAGGTLVVDALERDQPVKAVLALAGGIIGAIAVDRLLLPAGQQQERESYSKQELEH